MQLTYTQLAGDVHLLKLAGHLDIVGLEAVEARVNALRGSESGAREKLFSVDGKPV